MAITSRAYHLRSVWWNLAEVTHLSFLLCGAKWLIYNMYSLADSDSLKPQYIQSEVLRSKIAFQNETNVTPHLGINQSPLNKRRNVTIDTIVGSQIDTVNTFSCLRFW